jgi:hypothetical protein
VSNTSEIIGGASEFWEPWVPAVGQRVRVRFTSECRARPHTDSPQGDLAMPGHFAWEDGVTGVVTYDQIDTIQQGHRFMVRWDTVRDHRGYRLTGAVYAAAELRPLASD